MTTSRPTLADQAYTLVEEMIVTLRLPPGTVFSEADLRERIGIGRTPLREALQRLVADRLVMALPRRGMLVTEINPLDVLALLETRRVLDRLVVARAARRATPAQRQALDACTDLFRQAAEAGDLEAFMRVDRTADEVLAAAARNPFATQAAAPLHAHCRRFWYAHQHNGDLSRSAVLHQNVLAAVAQGREDAAEQASDALNDYLEQLTRVAMELV